MQKPHQSFLKFMSIRKENRKNMAAPYWEVNNLQKIYCLNQIRQSSSWYCFTHFICSIFKFFFPLELTSQFSVSALGHYECAEKPELSAQCHFLKECFLGAIQLEQTEISGCCKIKMIRNRKFNLVERYHVCLPVSTPAELICALQIQTLL